MFKVYILHSKFLDKYYIGFTSDIMEERLRKHNTNHKGYTGRTNDWEFLYHEDFLLKPDALKREKEIKSWKSRRMIEALLLQKIKNGSEHPDS